MSMKNVPLSSEHIPEGTGLIQSIECLGIMQSGDQKSRPLDQPVAAQITTFANRMRRVSCLHAYNKLGKGKCICFADDKNEITNVPCIYSWEDPQ